MFSDHRPSQPPGQVIADRAPGSWPSAMDPVGAPVMIRETDYSVRFALVTVASLVVAAFLIRMWFLQSSVASGNFVPLDPDHYMRHGRELARGGLGWQWTLDAIRYKWEGRTYLLPPLYPVFLSLFAVFPSAYPYSAAVGQIALHALSVAALFVIGACVHSRRAGVVAAFVYAFWIPNIWAIGQFLQEQLYIPLLLLAFALLLRATSRAASPAAFACAGAAFGMAALTRSMPVYFVIPAAIGYGLAAKDDPRTPRRVAALVAGFVVVTGAYSLWLSAQVGRLVFIENHGGISLHVYGGGRYGALGFTQTIALLVDTFASAPVRFVETWAWLVLASFNLHGDRWLLSYQAASATEATVAKLVAHTGIDLAFAASMLLAPIGIVLARRTREAALLALWIALVVGLTALSGTGGIRYRAPFEPHLLALASVVVAGSWRRPSRTALTVAGLAVVAAATILAPQFPRVARGRASYGVAGWTPAADGRRTWSQAGLGFHVMPRDGMVSLRLFDADGPVSADQPTRVSVKIDGTLVGDHALVASAPLQLRFRSRDTRHVYVEISATDGAGKPARVGIEVPK
jgi:Dolichyl-phosphate-mannose-protein mannosyltransferase